MTHSHLSAPGGLTGMGADGFQSLETTFKYRLFKDPVHEFVMSVGLSVEWGRTGAQSVGAEQFNTYEPTRADALPPPSASIRIAAIPLLTLNSIPEC